jgi:hypothetical protein
MEGAIPIAAPGLMSGVESLCGNLNRPDCLWNIGKGEPATIIGFASCSK